MADIETVELVADPYPPYQFQEGGAVRGVDHDMIAAAFRRRGLETRTTLLPWDECLRRVGSGEAHGIFQIQRSPEREQAFLFSRPIRTARTVFFQKAGRGFRFEEGGDPVAALSRCRLGVIAGYGYGEVVDAVPAEAKVAVDSQEELLQGLAEGRFDLAVTDVGVAAYLCGRLGLTGIERVAGPEVARVLHVAFNRGAGDLVDLFNAGFEQVEREGIRARIFQEYGIVE